ncbi:MAG: hypothetical protein ACJAW2_000350 [Shewanella sp.]|jgi:hypothetical protein
MFSQRSSISITPHIPLDLITPHNAWRHVYA